MASQLPASSQVSALSHIKPRRFSWDRWLRQVAKCRGNPSTIEEDHMSVDPDLTEPPPSPVDESHVHQSGATPLAFSLRHRLGCFEFKLPPRGGILPPSFTGPSKPDWYDTGTWVPPPGVSVQQAYARVEELEEERNHAKAEAKEAKKRFRQAGRQLKECWPDIFENKYVVEAKVWFPMRAPGGGEVQDRERIAHDFVLYEAMARAADEVVHRLWVEVVAARGQACVIRDFEEMRREDEEELARTLREAGWPEVYVDVLLAQHRTRRDREHQAAWRVQEGESKDEEETSAPDSW
ncbi:hypothetical protein VTJ04DRAFT_783 [Mycothermus thermophilus]|uniref:uncharacterized protein n=1 Tax=Humicola insolens TaxID=85995 RepID=UPI003742A391